MIEYNKIVNPITGRNVNLFGKKGQSILKKYINQVGGRLETRSIKCKPLLDSKLGEGGFKKAYTINCNKDTANRKCLKNKLLNCGKQYPCDQSTIVITNEKKDDFYAEVDMQKKLVETPKIYKYGKCADGNKFDSWESYIKDNGFHYKIEQKFTQDLHDYIEINHNNDFTLIDRLHNKKNDNNFKNSFKELFKQIKSFQKKGYGHFDIKPPNIGVVLNSEGSLESLNFIDFGLAKKINSRELGGTAQYLDPVTFDQDNMISTHHLDPFALGITLMGTLFVNNPFMYLPEPGRLRISQYFIDDFKRLLPKSDEGSDEWIRRIYSVNENSDNNDKTFMNCTKKFCKGKAVNNKKAWTKCYHKSARTHHPGKGGSEVEFKKLTVCNEFVNNNEGTIFNDTVNKIFEYPITTNLLYYILLLERGDRYSIDQILEHSFWKSEFSSEAADWSEKDEYTKMIDIIRNKRKAGILKCYRGFTKIEDIVKKIKQKLNMLSKNDEVVNAVAGQVQESDHNAGIYDNIIKTLSSRSKSLKKIQSGVENIDLNIFKFNIEEEMSFRKNIPAKIQHWLPLIDNMIEKCYLLEVNRQKRLEKAYGTSEIGCYCSGPCQHQSWCDSISGLCSYTKKCPVERKNCVDDYSDGIDLDKCRV